MNLLVEHTEDITDLMCRLSAAREDFPKMVRTESGKQGKYHYANRDQVLEKVKPILAKHELMLLQVPEMIDEFPGICHMLVNLKPPTDKPQWIKGHWKLTPADPGPQGGGSSITYNSRYGLCTFLGLEMEDDDAQRPQDKGEKPSGGAAGQSLKGADEWGPAKIADEIAWCDKRCETREQFVAWWAQMPEVFKQDAGVQKKLNGEWKEKFAEK